MIKFIKVISWLSALTWLVGYVLLVFNRPTYAYPPIYVGSFLLVFICLPLLYYFTRSSLDSKKLHGQWISGIIGMVFFVLSMWMKAAYIAGAPIVLIQAYLIITFGFFPLLFFNLYQKSLQSL